MRGHEILPAPLLRQARNRFIERGVCEAGVIDERVARSWQRSRSAGLSPIGRLVDDDALESAALQRLRTQNHELASLSLPIMDYLYAQVRLSHTMVILADRHGVLLHSCGDLDFLGKAERVALRCGASWNEARRGTNAIGTALAEAGDVEIHGAEHYLERNGFLTCAAAPIVSATGELLGILDISGDQRSRHPHTLGLVSTAAHMIENGLMLATCRQHLVLQFHPQAAGIGTVAQGLAAISEDGWWVGANRRALELLGLGARDIGSLRVEQVFDLRLDALLDHAGKAGARPLALRTAAGARVYAQIEAAARPALKAAPAAVRTPAADAPAADALAADALARLDTGDARWRAAADKARRAVGKDIALLLLGESGVGKEVFAKAVHQASARRERPFVAINCAALPETMIEAELFGYAPGAFTGARRDGSRGRLREADGGTLFLDEIGDMPLALQTRLLRVLQDREVVPLGGGRAVAVDFALVCATHQPLREAVEAGRFRADLYYRISGLSLLLPPLREREDFDALTARLLAELCEGDAPRAGVQVAPDLLAALRRHRWPGNLRQYRNVLRTAVAMLDPHEACVSWAHLPDDLVEELEAARAGDAPLPPQNLQELSRRAIRQALENARGNVSAAARQLGISRQTLYRRLREGRTP